jgi:hypothetical protein
MPVIAGRLSLNTKKKIAITKIIALHPQRWIRPTMAGSIKSTTL